MNGTSWVQNSDFYNENIPKKLLELYNPKYFIIEPQKYDLFPNNKTKDDYPLVNNEQISFQNFSMFYSMMKSIDLVYSYECSHKFKYDAIIRLRFDACPLQPIEIERYEITEYTKDVFYTNSCRNFEVISDWVMWSNSLNMRYLLNVYHFLDRYILEENVLGCGENILNHHIQKIGFKKCPQNISLFLCRDKDFKDKSFGIQY